MIVLAMDTAGPDCSAALYDTNADAILAEVTENIGIGHAEKLMGIIDRALAAADVELGAIDRLAVTVGPGSFTGIRVGVAAARGFALSLGIPAVGVTTLQVLAETTTERRADGPVIAAMDAKRGEVYIQPFDATGVAIGRPQLRALSEAISMVAGFDGVVTGSAAPLLRGEDQAGERDRFPISIVARLGAAVDLGGGSPSPLYLRGPDAKPQAGFAIPRI
ncbi:tRNA (adenosine(37)-N6)-threonylcarbamoyltransferase complex dimerization subunit type 1 TsaB [Rhizobiaceae bacterium n13]|uniref:tRNA (Adenosine(37)-N6)-threonylcarbamoyltransferase complex dimerization subunit type 1 TsaB n=1 Tax=Ferirhizobium litorale TaxID=2927786 RepID=A0AAE3QKU8_9HYPH|nr:tRNA (adenosine(37)-N6)-threonylcarbamoyltransferase complex dimerization subunit type 1 TsaB [Fererhizobium litorale]MDI7864725.1 tRNA (adenosine(37)-N6)-threonylcarbamoyltransferase complex dimerization subunit type 1 TsaB [Fererhizobium litorale]MDI7924994.1 tRNA (adenosine(37)-N6)-threonylcarbamoyltransferase complex dimerization subunit type 1 TsaB [Fererhizobium litorale]